MRMSWKIYPDEIPEESKRLSYLICSDHFASNVTSARYFNGRFEKYWGGWCEVTCHYWLEFPTPPPMFTKKNIEFGHYIYATPGLEKSLIDAGIVTILDLLNTPKKKILSIKGIGLKTFNKLIDDLHYFQIDIPKGWQDE